MPILATGNIDCGLLDRRVRLQYNVVGRDSAGAFVDSWVDAVTVWAGRTNIRGAKFFAAEGTQYEAIIGWRIRWRSDVAAGWRLIHGDDTYEIVVPPEEAGRRHFLDLTCRALNQTPGGNTDFLNLGDGETSFDLGDGATVLNRGGLAVLA